MAGADDDAVVGSDRVLRHSLLLECPLSASLPGHSRPKDAVASLAYVPGIHAFRTSKQDVDGRDKPGHDELWVTISGNDYCAASLVSSASLRSASGCGMAMML